MLAQNSAGKYGYSESSPSRGRIATSSPERHTQRERERERLAQIDNNKTNKVEPIKHQQAQRPKTMPAARLAERA
jgi:hypothetical protein